MNDYSRDAWKYYGYGNNHRMAEDENVLEKSS